MRDGTRPFIDVRNKGCLAWPSRGLFLLPNQLETLEIQEQVTMSRANTTLVRGGTLDRFP